jgi:hypothetical protein
MSIDDAHRQRLLDARQRLLVVLSEITTAVSEQSLVRCPYRTRKDVCTFRGACRNQLAQERAPYRCAGGALDPRPAAIHEIEAAALP